MQPNTLDIGGALKLAWDAFTKNAVALIVGALLMGIISGVSLGLCVGPMAVGYARLCLKAARGQQAEIGDLFSGFSDFGPAFLMMLIAAIAVGIGMILCVLPGVIIGFALSWAPYLMADGDSDAMSCLKRSWEFSKANLGSVIVFLIVAGIVGGIGGVIGGIGQLVTMPIGQMMVAFGFINVLGGGIGREAPVV